MINFKHDVIFFENVKLFLNFWQVTADSQIYAQHGVSYTSHITNNAVIVSKVVRRMQRVTAI